MSIDYKKRCKVLEEDLEECKKQWGMQIKINRHLLKEFDLLKADLKRRILTIKELGNQIRNKN